SDNLQRAVDQEAASYCWVCPSCGRRVPRRTIVCRCGVRYADARMSGASAPDLNPMSGGMSDTVRTRVMLAIAAIVLVAVPAWWIGRPSAPATTSENRAPRPTIAPAANPHPVTVPVAQEPPLVSAEER